MSGLTITSSVLAAAALDLAPEGVPAKDSGTCTFCGLHIAAGDLCSPFSVSSSFMDDLSLASRGSGLTCGHCAPLMSADALRRSGYGVFARSGLRPFRKWAEITAALTHPPNEPFSMVYATANNQHMAWRAPVNFSPELFYVRVGLRDLKIRHAILMQAVDTCQKVADAFGFPPTAKTLAHPFANLSADLKEVGHGMFRGKMWADKEKLSQNRTDIQFLMNLTLGETWALRFLLTPGAGT